jgi:UDPglucose 6-dehydrogenase
MAKSRRVPLPLVRAVQKINQRQPHIAIGKLRRLLGSLKGKTIGILGLSFKPNSDDMREATSLSIISLLQQEGCQVKAYDPLAMPMAARLMPQVTYFSDAYQVAVGSDALILVTDWDEFKELDMVRIASSMKHPILIDGRNLLDPDKVTEANIVYEGIGRHGPEVLAKQSVGVR